MSAPGGLIVGWALLGLPGLGSEAAVQEQQGCLPACRLGAPAKAQLWTLLQPKTARGTDRERLRRTLGPHMANLSCRHCATLRCGTFSSCSLVCAPVPRLASNFLSDKH